MQRVDDGILDIDEKYFIMDRLILGAWNGYAESLIIFIERKNKLSIAKPRGRRNLNWRLSRRLTPYKVRRRPLGWRF